MESQQQSQSNTGVSWYVVLVLVILAFGLGIFVGFHPQWIPIKTSGGSADVMPLPSGPAPASQPNDGHPLPATMPAMDPK